MIGIIGAMRIEVDALKAKLANPVTETISGIDFHQGQLNGVDVVVAVSGIGKVFAAICAQTMILRFGVDKIINSGVAGTLSDKLHIGDVAISTALVQHDMDTSCIGDPHGLLSGINIVKLPADEDIYRGVESVAKELGMNCLLGTIATGDQFIANAERKQWIKDTFDGIAVEMESGSIAHVCYVNRIPFAAIRVISDEASGEASMDYMEFVKLAADRSMAITEKLLPLIAR
ncbi:MAG: 5'-methylthioadenosine/adenosylhomocysteine nucleosidase [Duodenibacillus sp.]|nr:5'-methylthioadenosine/adenosylhomocysteine nucleosidase [Duodenibacillus sp.]